MSRYDFLIAPDEQILVTGATGFIGQRLVRQLLGYGFQNLRCLTRPSSSPERVKPLLDSGGAGRVEFVYGNLLNRKDCAAACKNVTVVFHLAAGRGEKSYPDAYLNSVVTTRNLLEACAQSTTLKRIVNVSSFAVYSNRAKRNGRLLDESSPVEEHPELRGEAYCFAKVKQDEMVVNCAHRLGVSYVIVRPGVVYGPGNEPITGRVGTGTFGAFIHLGGGNTIPFTYVDNCADAIALAGVTKSVDNEIFNIVDDDLPSSCRFLRLYKKNVRRFRSIYIPHMVSYMLCRWWECYSALSNGQLPSVFNQSRWHANWKKTTYTNRKAKERLGWAPKVSTSEGLKRYFSACRDKEKHA